MKIPASLKKALWVCGAILSLYILYWLSMLIYFVVLMSSGTSRDEVARIPSTNGSIEAVLIETNGGATTSFGYEIYVVEAGKPPSDEKPPVFLYGSLRSDSAYGANLKWDNPNQLAIEFFKAESKQINSPEIMVKGQKVRIVLREGIIDSNAPHGGMLYNLEGRPNDHP